METLTFQPIVSPWVLTAIFVIGALMLLIGPSFVNLSGSRRLTLSLLRMGVLAMAVLATLRPGCVQQIEKNQAAVLLFLVDQTRSMQLPHVSDDSTRWQAVKKVVEENESRFKQLIENKIDVRFFSFDNRVAQLESENGRLELPDTPEGSETDIGSAIYQTSIDVRDQRLLGVFLLSDGVQNVLDPPVELTEAAETLNDMEVALYAVQLGLPGDTGQLADISITNFPEQHIVNVKNDLRAKATLIARGYANQDVKVDLLLVDSKGQETVVKSEIVRISGGYDEQNVELVYRPTEPGEFRLKIRANPMPGELAVRNNELDAFLTVNDKGMRVLFLCGNIGNEQRFLRQSLPAADFIQMDFVPIYPSTRDQWKNNMARYEALFKDPAYDVFILCDLDSRALYDSNSYTGALDALTDAVYNGKGLLMIGGYHSFGAGLYQNTPLANVLPIQMEASEGQEFDEDVRRDLHVNSPLKLRPAKDHFTTRLGDEESNRTLWQKLPPLVGANRIVPKENAEIFLQSDDEVARPVMVAATVGGRVIAFAGDSTWRWNMPRTDPDSQEIVSYKDEFDQFWRQVVLWLAFWDARNDETVSIELPKRRFQPKAIIKFDVVVDTIAGEAIENVVFDAALVSPLGQRTLINISRLGDRYFGELDPELVAESGLYRIEVAAEREGVAIGTSKREFVVMDRDKEKSNPVANPEQMVRLASQTADHGGRAMVPDEVADRLDELIKNPPMTKIEIPLKWRLGETFSDAAVFLSIFVILLTAEWMLRKKWGLV
jgi:uncharacterized membrane protein